MTNSAKTIKIIDGTIFVFLFLFFASLMNSIFVNQIGYFGALIFLLVRFWITKENPFRKTGLELFFTIFLIAEILSTVFSVAPDQSFHNFLKRILLIPTFYVVLYAGSEEKRGVFFVKTFLIFSVLSSFFYLWNSYSYYLRGLFQLTGSGPFLFHYPITTSELFSFTAILLLAFLFNKDMTKKIRLLTLLAFAVTFLSLLATFKRTGWIGFIAGVLTILILNRKYFYLLLFAVIVIAGIALEKSKSEILFLKKSGGEFKKETAINTDGQALWLARFNDKLIVSDYTGGLLTTDGKNTQKYFSFETPIVKIKKWNDNYFVARLIDTRFLLLRKSENGFSKTGEFITPGYTRDFQIIQNNVYVLDSDSGVTIFTNPEDLSDIRRIKSLKNYLKILAFNKFAGFFSKSEGLSVYAIDSLGITAEKAFEIPAKDKPLFAGAFGDTLFVQVNGSAAFLDLRDSSKSLNPIKTNLNLNEIYGALRAGDEFYLITLGGNIFSAKYPFTSEMFFKKEYSLGFNPKSFILYDGALVVTHVKRNRFMTTFDPYNQSNAVRISLWTAGVKMFLDYPLFGVGDIDLANLYREYKKPYEKEIQGHLHNNYFHLLATLGGFGFIASMLLFWKIFSLLYKSYKRAGFSPYASSFALGALAAFVSFLSAGLFEWNFGDHEIITYIWFAAGMAVALGKTYEQKNG